MSLLSLLSHSVHPRLSLSVCVSVRMIEPKRLKLQITKLATGIVRHEFWLLMRSIYCMYCVDRSARCRGVCTESTYEPGIARDATDHRDHDPYHRPLHYSLSRWINDATHEGLGRY